MPFKIIGNAIRNVTDVLQGMKAFHISMKYLRTICIHHWLCFILVEFFFKFSNDMRRYTFCVNVKCVSFRTFRPTYFLMSRWWEYYIVNAMFMRRRAPWPSVNDNPYHSFPLESAFPLSISTGLNGERWCLSKRDCGDLFPNVQNLCHSITIL